jgi:hypothetical protein
MSQGNADLKTTALLRKPGGEPMQQNCRPPIAITGYLDLSPPYRTGTGKRLHGLIHRLFGRDSRGRIPGGIRPGGQIAAFILGEEPSHCLLALVGQEPANSVEVDQIYSDAHNCHERDHQNSANPRSGEGTGTYPPSTSPR